MSSAWNVAILHRGIVRDKVSVGGFLFGEFARPKASLHHPEADLVRNAKAPLI